MKHTKRQPARLSNHALRRSINNHADNALPPVGRGDDDDKGEARLVREAPAHPQPT